MKFHFIAIGGTGMGSVAGLLQLAGHDVRGSDEHLYPPMSTMLEQLGIDVFLGYAPENLDWGPDVVVVGNVCRRDHVEAVAAQERGLPLTSFPAVLSEHFLGDRHPVVVAGTHGKTTCASLLATLLHSGEQDPSFLIGGIPENFGRGFRLGAGPHFVLEGDEYDTAFFDKGSKFLHYRPRSVLLTGVEFDHADIFPDLEAVRSAFRAFLELVPSDGRVVVWAGSPEALALAEGPGCAAQVETYALQEDPGAPQTVTWRGRVVRRLQPGAELEITRASGPTFRLRTLLTGAHNWRNVLGCAALAHGLGLPTETIARGSAAFLGVKRRQQVRGVAMGVTVIDDFAHHPTAVRETLAGLRDSASGRLVAVFEPRSATSRRAVFQKAYAEAFDDADLVVVGPPYDPSRIPEAERLDPNALVASLRQRSIEAAYIPSVEEIVAQLATRLRPGDAVAVLSSGSFGNLHRKLLLAIGDAVTPAEPGDEKNLERLLESLGLPTVGVGERLHEYIVLRSRFGLAGCIGLERRAHCGLLKDLAVVPERRGEGLSWLLAEAAIKEARRHGIRDLYMFGIPETLRTGENLGFNVVSCDTVDEALRDSPTLEHAWYSRAGVCLRLRLQEDN